MFNPQSGQLVAEIIRRKALLEPAPWTIMEFGNQRFDAYGIAPGEPKTTAEFYSAFGFELYVAVDTNTNMDAVIGDLNYPLAEQDNPRFVIHYDLVTNLGTGEHVFNQAAVFQNAHDRCRIGGVMLHQLPFHPWVNHGFFNFNPILFRDLAAANDYDVVFFALGDRDGKDVLFLDTTDAWVFKEKRPAELEKMLRERWKKDVFMCAAYRKRVDAPFRFPLQGKYIGDVTDSGLQALYQ